MKMRCEVLTITSDGETLSVGLQGSPKASAKWRTLERQELKIPDTERSRRAFWLGRIVTIDLRLGTC